MSMKCPQIFESASEIRLFLNFWKSLYKLDFEFFNRLTGAPVEVLPVLKNTCKHLIELNEVDDKLNDIASYENKDNGREGCGHSEVSSLPAVQ
jgi:hypothetical protein